VKNGPKTLRGGVSDGKARRKNPERIQGERREKAKHDLWGIGKKRCNAMGPSNLHKKRRGRDTKRGIPLLDHYWGETWTGNGEKIFVLKLPGWGAQNLAGRIPGGEGLLRGKRLSGLK